MAVADVAIAGIVAPAEPSPDAAAATAAAEAVPLSWHTPTHLPPLPKDRTPQLTCAFATTEAQLQVIALVVAGGGGGGDSVEVVIMVDDPRM